MDTIDVKGKPRGRNGGRKFGSKDRTPRISQNLNKTMFIRVSAELMQRIERRASLQGEKISDFIRGILEEQV